MTNRGKIQECLLNIDMVCRAMYLSFTEVRKLKLPLNSVVLGDVIRYSYIQFCIILDEFEILHGLAKDDIYLRDTLFIVKPSLKGFKQYTGIRKARNILLAHFNRSKTGEFKPWWIELKNLKLPRTQKEIGEIHMWLHLTNSVLVTRYYEEIKELSLKSKPLVDEYFEWVKSDEKQSAITPTPLRDVFKEVDDRMKKKGMQGVIIDPIMKELISLNK